MEGFVYQGVLLVSTHYNAAAICSCAMISLMGANYGWIGLDTERKFNVTA